MAYWFVSEFVRLLLRRRKRRKAEGSHPSLTKPYEKKGWLEIVDMSTMIWFRVGVLEVWYRVNDLFSCPVGICYQSSIHC